MHNKIIIVGGLGLVFGAVIEWFAPSLLGVLPSTSLIKQGIELPLSGIEQLSKYFARVLDPEYRALAPSDSSFTYAVYILIFFAVIGATMAVLGYLAVRSIWGIWRRTSATRHIAHD